MLQNAIDLSIHIEELCEEYNIYYVDIFDIFDNNEELLPNPFEFPPSPAGVREIR